MGFTGEPWGRFSALIRCWQPWDPLDVGDALEGQYSWLRGGNEHRSSNIVYEVVRDDLMHREVRVLCGIVLLLCPLLNWFV